MFDKLFKRDSEPLEIRHNICRELSDLIKPVGQGETVFPFEQVRVLLFAKDEIERATFQRVFLERQRLETAILDRLKQEQCNLPDNLLIEIEIRLVEKESEARTYQVVPLLNDPREGPKIRKIVGRLKVLLGHAQQTEYEITKAVTYIGRMDEVLGGGGLPIRRNDLVFLDRRDEVNLSVGREHAYIKFDAQRNEYRLFNDKSRSGTFIFRNGKRREVAGGLGYKLQDGDDIYFGRARVLFKLEECPDEQPVGERNDFADEPSDAIDRPSHPRSSAGNAYDYLTTAAALIILRWADQLETKAEAIAKSEGKPFDRLLPYKGYWSYWKDLPAEHALSQLAESLHTARGDSRAAEILTHIAEALQPERIDPQLFEKAVLLIGFMSDGSASGGPRLADAFEQLLLAAPDSNRSWLSEFTTPAALTELMLELADLQPGERLYDPCCGVASVLATAGRRLVEAGQLQPTLGWYGVEINPIAFLVAQARLILSGSHTLNLELGDALDCGDTPTRFDCIIASPPFGANVNSPLNDSRGVKSETLFLQHVMASLNPGGRAVMLLPEGLLFSTSEADIRRRLLEEFHVDGVLSLSPSALGPYTTAIKTSIVVFRRAESAQQVWFQTAPPTLQLGREHDEGIGAAIREIGYAFRQQVPGRHGWFATVNELAERNWALFAVRENEEVAELVAQLQEQNHEVEISTLGDLANVFAGANYTEQDTTEDPAQLPAHHNIHVVRAGDLRAGRVNLPPLYLNENTFSRVNEDQRLKTGDLLLSVTGSIGKVGQVSSNEAGAVATHSLLIVRPDGTKIKPDYLLRLFQSTPYQRCFRGYSRNALTQHLSVQVLRSLPIPAPSLDIQNRIAGDLQPDAEAGAILHALVAGRAASELEHFLQTDKAIGHLLEDYESIDGEELKRSLLEVANGLLPWRERAAHDLLARVELNAWLIEVTKATELLVLALDAPQAAERFVILEELKQIKAISALARVETNDLAQRISAINTTLARLIEGERDKLLATAISGEGIAPTVIDADTDANSLRRLFGSTESFTQNLRGLVEVRQSHLQFINVDIQPRLAKAIEYIDKSPEEVLVHIRRIVKTVFKLIWDAEFPDGKIPDEWIRQWQHAGERNPPGSKVPTEGGESLKLLYLMTDSRKAVVRAKVSRSTYYLLNSLHSYGNFGNHSQGEKVSAPFAALACLTVIELLTKLSGELDAIATYSG